MSHPARLRCSDQSRVKRMSEFHVQLGRNDAKAGRHVEPIGWSDDALADWRKGHGPGWMPRNASPVTATECSSRTNSIGSRNAASAAPAVSAAVRPAQPQQPYTPFSTPATKRRATSESGNSAKTSGRSPAASNGTSKIGKTFTTRSRNSSPASSTATPPKPVMGLFGPIEDMSEKTPRAKPPAPIPDVDRDAEMELLMRIGVGQSAAVALIDANWTLDQLKCRWQLNDWSDHPKFVQEVSALVAAHCEQQWPRQKPKAKDMEVSNAGALTEAV